MESPTADQLDQQTMMRLHELLLHISATCFEIKKICATVLVASATLIVSFSDGELGFPLFVGALALVGIFWTLDALSYKTQVRIRTRLDTIALRRVDRITPPIDPGSRLDYLALPLPPERTQSEGRILRAFFNRSMAFYFILLTAILLSMVFTLDGSAWPPTFAAEQ
jgi:hypothetical protein